MPRDEPVFPIYMRLIYYLYMNGVGNRQAPGKKALLRDYEAKLMLNWWFGLVVSRGSGPQIPKGNHNP